MQKEDIRKTGTFLLSPDMNSDVNLEITLFNKASLLFSSLYPVGQRHVPHPGRKEPDEHSGVHRQGLLRRIYQVQQEQKHGVPQHARYLLEDESSREEASGEEREAGRRPNQQGQEILSEEAYQPRAGSERVQSHG